MDRSKLLKAYRESAWKSPFREIKRIVHGDVPTFMEFPMASHPGELQGAHAAFIGFPHEGFRPYSPRELMPPKGARAPRDSVYFRTGTDEAPASVRRWSLHHSILHYGGEGYMVEWDMKLSDWIKAVDYGDVDCRYGDIPGNVNRAKDRVEEVVRAGAIPLVQGGDHSTPIPALLGIAECTNERIGIIGFDAHFDLYGLEEDISEDFKYSATCQYMRALELPNVEPENVVLIGMKGIHNPEVWARIARNLGIEYFTMKDIDDLGIDEVVKRALDRACSATTRLYVTLDIDVVDFAMCPGQRYPDTPGLSPREIVRALRRIGERGLVSGFDISCLSPQYDETGATQLLAARCHLEVLSGIAHQFRARRRRP
jgi:agmatinase